MPAAVQPDRSAVLALSRLRGDQAVRPVQDARGRLSVLSARLDRAARQCMTAELAGRVRADRRFAPILGRLMRMSLDA